MIHSSNISRLLVQLEDVYCLCVGAEGQVVAVLREGQAVHVSTSLDTSPELHQSRPVLDTEDPDDGSSLSR